MGSQQGRGQQTNQQSSKNTYQTSEGGESNYQAKKETKKTKPEYIYGINPVLASLSAQRREFQKLYLSITEKGEGKKSNPKIDQIYKMAKTQGIAYKYLHKVKLNKFTVQRPNQNVVLKCSKLDYIRVKRIQDLDIMKNEQGQQQPQGKLILFLDQITDPQNFGSILRTAMFIGVDAVLVNHKNACGLTPTVSKVSSGALEFIPLYSVRFVKKFMQDAQKTGQFKVIATDIISSNEEKGAKQVVQEEDNSLIKDSDDDDDMFDIEAPGKKQKSKQQNQQPKYYDEDDGLEDEEDDDTTPYTAHSVVSIEDLKLRKEDNVILVLGSEGEGVSRSINKLADHRVMIPPQLSKDQIGKYPFNMVDSLNVGVSAGVLIYHLRYLMKRV